MTRALRFIFRNWPLKLAAIVLATMLYVGLVVSQSTRQMPVNVRIEPLNVPERAVLIDELPVVTQVTFLARDVAPSSESFVATVDLSGVDPNGGPQLVDVDLRSIEGSDVSPIDWTPRRIRVDLDPVSEKQVPVSVDTGAVPETLEADQPTLGTDTVTVSGPATLVERVVAAQANVLIGPNAFDIDRDLPLDAVDANGERVPEVRIDPATVHVTIHVFENKESRTLPVTVPVAGAPPPGFSIGAITTDPVVVSVGGEAADLGPLRFVQTEAVSLTNQTSDIRARVPLVLPDGIVALDVTSVEVRIAIRPTSETRLYQVGIELTGERNDLGYALGRDRVLVTLLGSPPDLDRLSESSFVVDVDVSGLAIGRHDVPIRVDLPTGLELVALSPERIRVEVSAATPSPSPSSAPSEPPASPSPSPSG